uniref:Ig-like domain-containing protein n=1 Tax=Salarias fasciatus TaxID=181472 RepID=A0A672HG31_SALFA
MKTKQRDHMLLAAMSLGMNTTLAQKDNVLQPRGEVTADEGHSITLDCLYNTTSSSNYYLFWYKQEGNKSPKFILSRFKLGEGKTEDEEKYSSTLDSSLRSVPLKIQKLELSDSAVYYCALQPTVTGNSSTVDENLWSKDNTILLYIH